MCTAVQSRSQEYDMESVGRLSILLNRLSERYSIFDTTEVVPETFQVEKNDLLFIFFMKRASEKFIFR